MEGTKTLVPSSSPSDTQHTNAKQYSSPDDLELETFFVKLTQVLESTGFNLMLVSSKLFNLLLIFTFVCLFIEGNFQHFLLLCFGF